MAIWLTSGAEVLLQMMTGLGLYRYVYGEREETGKRRKVLLTAAAAGIWALETYNARFCIFSIIPSWVHILLESIWLSWKAKGKWITSFSWSTFYKWLFVMTKMPILVISGLLNQSTLPGVINRPNIGTAIAGLSITMVLYLFCMWKKQEIRPFLEEVLNRYRKALLLIGCIELLGIVYVLNILEIQFEVYMFVFVIILLILLIFCMGVFGIYMKYQENEKEKQILLARERVMSDNYVLLKKEQEENRRHIHEFRHELEYLYQCLRRQEYEAGELYLEKKSREIGKQQKEQLWTGSGCIDFLVNKTRVQAGEKGIRFESEVNVLEIPVEEYDLFMILSNLLENAVEAAQQCEEGERYIRLQIFTVNRMFFLLVENSYAKEPEERDGRFVTSKGDRTAHGWGLENVKETVKRYGGECEIRYGNQVFSLQIILGV